MKSSLSDFYKGKNVLVTGHTGFKGSWLSIWLNEMGANVIGYALDPYTSQDNFVVTNLSEKINDIRGEIRDYDNLLRTFKEEKPEIVFHLAAQPLVRLSYEKPRETYETNVMGTINVLEASRKSESVKVVIIVTSDKCYENNGWIWGYRENDSLGGYDPYSSSKACTELVTSSYINSYFNKGNNEESDVGVASVRAGNVIGGGDWAKDRLITDCIISLKKGNTIEIRSPKAIRPWQHVLEPIRGYMLLALKLHKDQTKYKGSWNFGPDNSSIVTVGELVDKILKVWGAGKWIDVSNDNNLHEANFLKLDASKAKFHLGWETQLNIDESIQLLVNWYKQYEEENVYQLCVNQINDYIEKIN